MFGKEKELEESPWVKKGRKRLYELGIGDQPAQPLRQIAPMPEVGELARLLGLSYMGQGTPQLRTMAEQETMRQFREPVDPLRLPEVRGLMDIIGEQGRLEANRLRRGLQLGGMEASTTGRDVLGRSVTGTQTRMASAVAPYLTEYRRQRTELPERAEYLARAGEGATMAKAGFGAEMSDWERALQQAKLDAMLEQAIRELAFKYQIQPNLLLQMMSESPALITGGEQGILPDLIRAGGQMAAAGAA